MEEVLDKQRQKLETSPELKKEVQQFLEELRKKNLNAVLGGSVAMGTNLSDKDEADIFIKTEGPDYSEKLEKFLKNNNYEYKKLHGSRDYFQIYKNQVLYELIPVKQIQKPEEAETIVDMSPFHVEYFQKNLTQELKQEIKLAKSFCKAHNIYGAESHIKGFSGHVLNILIIHYKSFKELLIQSQKWKPKVIIDLDKKIKDPLMELDKSKIEGPLIVVDPVYKYRNAAAAVSEESFNKFKKKAKEFIKKPSLELFEKEKIEDLITKDHTVLEIMPLDDKDDVAGSKIIKIKEHIERELENNGFEIKQSLWEYKKPSLLALKTKFLGKKAIITGPPLDMKEHANKFKKKHKKYYEENGILKAEITRKYHEVEDLLKELIKNSYVKERCKSIKIKNR